MIKHAPEFKKRLRWSLRPVLGYSWQVDKTYIKVKGTFIELSIDEDIPLIFIFHSQETNLLLEDF